MLTADQMRKVRTRNRSATSRTSVTPLTFVGFVLEAIFSPDKSGPAGKAIGRWIFGTSNRKYTTAGREVWVCPACLGSGAVANGSSHGSGRFFKWVFQWVALLAWALLMIALLVSAWEDVEYALEAKSDFDALLRAGPAN